MQFVRCFGVNYYVVASMFPPSALYYVNQIVARFGNDLDVTGPYWARYGANILLRKYGALNIA